MPYVLTFEPTFFGSVLVNLTALVLFCLAAKVMTGALQSLWVEVFHPRLRQRHTAVTQSQSTSSLAGNISTVTRYSSSSEREPLPVLPPRRRTTSSTRVMRRDPCPAPCPYAGRKPTRVMTSTRRDPNLGKTTTVTRSLIRDPSYPFGQRASAATRTTLRDPISGKQSSVYRSRTTDPVYCPHRQKRTFGADPCSSGQSCMRKSRRNASRGPVYGAGTVVESSSYIRDPVLGETSVTASTSFTRGTLYGDSCVKHSSNYTRDPVDGCGSVAESTSFTVDPVQGQSTVWETTSYPKDPVYEQRSITESSSFIRSSRHGCKSAMKSRSWLRRSRL